MEAIPFFGGRAHAPGLKCKCSLLEESGVRKMLMMLANSFLWLVHVRLSVRKRRICQFDACF